MGGEYNPYGPEGPPPPTHHRPITRYRAGDRRLTCGCLASQGCRHLLVMCPRGHTYDGRYYGNFCPKCRVNHLVVSNDWRGGTREELGQPKLY